MSTLLSVLQHALGVDEFGRGQQYRSHFVTGTGCADHAACMEAVAGGLMTRRDGSPVTGGDDLFLVTAAGRAHVAEFSPAPPKRTRSQRRYQDYLDADSRLSFGERLRRNPILPHHRQSSVAEIAGMDSELPF